MGAFLFFSDAARRFLLSNEPVVENARLRGLIRTASLALQPETAPKRKRTFP
jgi:hypothetical protein